MSRPTITMRFDCPAQLNHRLHIAASHLQVSVKDLLLDGAALVLRYNDQGHGVEQPPLRTPPVMPVQPEEAQEIEAEVEEGR